MPIPVTPVVGSPGSVRRRFPDEGSRLAYGSRGSGLPITGKAGQTVYVYTDAAGTSLATDLQDANGGAITNGQLTIGSDSLIPVFFGPTDLTDTLWVKIGTTGNLVQIWSRYDDRLDSLEQSLGALSTITDVDDLALDSEIEESYVSALVIAGIGIDPTGVTESTTAIQAKLDLAHSTSMVVYWPEGTYLVDTLNYKNQSMSGADKKLTIIKGKPGKDVFHWDPTVSTSAREKTHLSDFTVVVDDSVNAVASFPTRSGSDSTGFSWTVGNAAFACDRANGTTETGARWNNATIERVEIISTSMSNTGQNNSCGFYLQNAGFNLTTVQDVAFRRLDYGLWMDRPRTNPASMDYAPDHNVLSNVYFNSCGKPAFFLNMNASTFENVTFHGTSDIGPIWDSYQSLSRNETSALNISSSYIEQMTATPLRITGSGHTWDGGYIAGPHGTVEFAASESYVLSLGIFPTAATPPVFRVTGNRNIICLGGINGTTSVDYAFDLVEDTGVGNEVTATRITSSSKLEHRQILTKSAGPRHLRDAESIIRGHVGELFISGRDLLIDPTAVRLTSTEGVNFTYAVDTATTFGKRLRVEATTAAFQINRTTGTGGLNSLVVGKFIPAAPCRLYIRAKVATAGTQTISVSVGGVGAGSTSVSWGTTYSTQFIDFDAGAGASGADVQITGNNLGGGGVGPLDIEWIAFRPFAADALISGYTEGKELAADPAAPASNSGRYYFRDNGAGKTQFVVRFPTGAVQVLATEP